MSLEHSNDYSELTWMSLLGLLAPLEYFITVDHSAIWRRHLAWAKESGSELRTHMTQRFASNMVFMSLVLGAELGVLFNSSQITTNMRDDMRNSHYLKVEFWIGVVICVSVILTLFALMTTFTAWGMVSSVSDRNAHCILRSSIGQYITQLPARLIVAAIYSFLLWIIMFLFVLLPGLLGGILLFVVGVMFFHTVVVFSAFGRLIVHTGAMGSKPILDPDFEKALLPSGLHTSLLIKATLSLRKKTCATAQYRSRNHSQRVQFNETDNSAGAKTQTDSLHQGEEFSMGGTSDALSSCSRTRSTGSLTCPDAAQGTVAAPERSINRHDSAGRLSLGERRISLRLSGAQELNQEWQSDSECRSMYNAPPPAELLANSDEAIEWGESSWSSIGGTRLPRPSMLNSANHTFDSFRRLTSGLAGSKRNSETGFRLKVPMGLNELLRVISGQQSEESGENPLSRSECRNTPEQSTKIPVNNYDDPLALDDGRCFRSFADDESSGMHTACTEKQHLLAGLEQNDKSYSHEVFPQSLPTPDHEARRQEAAFGRVQNSVGVGATEMRAPQSFPKSFSIGFPPPESDSDDRNENHQAGHSCETGWDRQEMRMHSDNFDKFEERQQTLPEEHKKRTDESRTSECSHVHPDSVGRDLQTNSFCSPESSLSRSVRSSKGSSWKSSTLVSDCAR